MRNCRSRRAISLCCHSFLARCTRSCFDSSESPALEGLLAVVAAVLVFGFRGGVVIVCCGVVDLVEDGGGAFKVVVATDLGEFRPPAGWRDLTFLT